MRAKPLHAAALGAAGVNHLERRDEVGWIVAGFGHDPGGEQVRLPLVFMAVPQKIRADGKPRSLSEDPMVGGSADDGAYVPAKNGANLELLAGRVLGRAMT